MDRWTKLIGVLGLMILAGCGYGDVDAPAGGTEVQAALTWQAFPSLIALPASDLYKLAPPPAVRFVVPTTARPIVSSVGADGGTITVCPNDISKSTIEISTDFSTVRGASVFTLPSGKRAVAFVGEDSATGKGRLEVYVDDDEDADFDGTDLSVEIVDDTGASSSSWTWVEFAGTELYVLDSRNLEVRRVTTPNSDGVPGTLQSAAFLDTTQTHFISLALEMEWHSADSRLCLRQKRSDSSSHSDTLWVRDVDADGQADEYALEAYEDPTDAMTPHFATTPLDGEESAHIVAPRSAAVEVWRVDPTTEADIQLLGSGTVPSNDPTLEISLSTAPVEGWAIVLRDTTNSRTSTPSEVFATQTRIISTSPRDVDSTSTTTVTLRGYGFDASVTATAAARFDLPTGFSISTTFVSSKEVTLSIPAVGTTADPLYGELLITLEQSGEEIGVTSVYVRIP